MIKIVSFGYKIQAPPAAAYRVFDCRELPNPYNVPTLKKLDGTNTKVQQFVRMGGAEFDALVEGPVQIAYDMDQKGEAVLLAFGCVGGRHRSVAVAEEVATRLRNMDVLVKVTHLEL